MSLLEEHLLSPSGKWSTFYVADELLAVRVEDVQEILMPQALTPVPLAPSHVLGLLNLRGQVMPVLDLRPRLGFPPAAAEGRGRLMVLTNDAEPYAVMVDEVGDVIELGRQSWLPVPPTLAAARREHVFGINPIEHRIVLGLRLAALWTNDGAEGAQ